MWRSFYISTQLCVSLFPHMEKHCFLVELHSKAEPHLSLPQVTWSMLLLVGYLYNFLTLHKQGVVFIREESKNKPRSLHNPDRSIFFFLLSCIEYVFWRSNQLDWLLVWEFTCWTKAIQSHYNFQYWYERLIFNKMIVAQNMLTSLLIFENYLVWNSLIWLYMVWK